MSCSIYLYSTQNPDMCAPSTVRLNSKFFIHDMYHQTVVPCTTGTRVYVQVYRYHTYRCIYKLIVTTCTPVPPCRLDKYIYEYLCKRSVYFFLDI